jgi:hypothetical protein
MAIGPTNAHGGGSGKIKSIIAVTYPAGSTCTCTKGSTTLTSKDTSGTALFNVDIGEWTVKSTDGTNTASNTASITADGQFVEVRLEYSFYLYKDGDEFVERTGGWISKAMGHSPNYPDGHILNLMRGDTSIKAESPDNAGARTGIIICENKINLTGITTIEASCLGRAENNDLNGLNLTVLSNDRDGYLSTLGVAAIAVPSSWNSPTILDVSNLHGEFFIVFSIYTYGWIKSVEFSSVLCKAGG